MYGSATLTIEGSSKPRNAPSITAAATSHLCTRTGSACSCTAVIEGAAIRSSADGTTPRLVLPRTFVRETYPEFSLWILSHTPTKLGGVLITGGLENPLQRP